MKTLRNLLFIFIPTLIFGCSHLNSVSEQVAAAEMAMAADDVASTQKICDNLTSTPFDKSGLEAVELCRLSILYMQLDERTDSPDALNQAVKCYREAWKLNPDSAQAYFDHLPVDLDKYAMTLSNLSQAIDNPGEIPVEDHDLLPGDSI